MDFNSANLTRINPQETGAYLSDEIGYYAAFCRHMEVAQVLYDPAQCYREAYSILLFSVECYLKDLFCVLRYQIIGGFNQATQSDYTKKLPDAIRKKIANSLKPFSFNHDIRKIALFVQELCSNLKNDEDYQLFLSRLPLKENWIDERYDDPSKHSHIDFKAEFDNLRESLEAVRLKCFARFK